MSETQTIDSSRRPLIILGIGDVLSLVLFSMIGRQTHAEGLTLQSVLLTAAPFVIAWFILASVLRGYRPALLASPQVMFMQSLVIAIGASSLGVFLRSAFLKVPVVPLFVLVAIPMATLFILGWRMIFIWVYRWSQASPGAATAPPDKAKKKTS